MPQRDYILRLIEQLGAALTALRKRILRGDADADEVERELADASSRAGFDIGLLRSLTVESLYLFAAPQGEVEPTRCWLMAEALFVDGLAAAHAGHAAAAEASLIKARALYDLVRPGGAMLVGLTEATARIESIDALLAELPGGRTRRSSHRPRRAAPHVRSA